MANFLPKDEELFDKIAREHIQVAPELWTVIYQHIGDAIMAIRLLVYNYAQNDLPVPKDKAKEVIRFTDRIIDVIAKITYHDRFIKDDDPDPFFQIIKKKELKLDPVTDELFGNYVRNDVYVISLIAQNYVDPLDTGNGIPVKDSRKILEHIDSTIRFMDKLMQATLIIGKEEKIK